jgi:hypothetical protein
MERMIVWLHQSPDLNTMDVSLRAHLKEHIYTVPPDIVQDLVTRLQAALTKVNGSVLKRVRENAVRRITVCLEMDRGRFENLLKLSGPHGFIMPCLAPFYGGVYLQN